MLTLYKFFFSVDSMYVREKWKLKYKDEISA